MRLCGRNKGMGKGFILPPSKTAFYCVTKRTYRRLDDTPVLVCTLYDSYPVSVCCDTVLWVAAVRQSSFAELFAFSFVQSGLFKTEYVNHHWHSHTKRIFKKVYLLDCAVLRLQVPVGWGSGVLLSWVNAASFIFFRGHHTFFWHHVWLLLLW